MLRLYNDKQEDIPNQPRQFCGNPACLGEPWCSAWGICAASTIPEELETPWKFYHHDFFFGIIIIILNYCGYTIWFVNERICQSPKHSDHRNNSPYHVTQYRGLPAQHYTEPITSESLPVQQLQWFKKYVCTNHESQFSLPLQLYWLNMYIMYVVMLCCTFTKCGNTDVTDSLA